MNPKSEFLVIAKQVLEEEQKALTPREIVDIAIRNQLFSDKHFGKTPHQTLKSKLSVHVRKYGNESFFVRTEPGKFFLRRLLQPNEAIYDAKPFRRIRPSEDVLVFDTASMENFSFQGIRKGWRTYHKRLLNDRICYYQDRLLAEKNDHSKQILTYIMITRKGQVLAYKRGNVNRVEDFLRGSFCIGFGGHITQEDSNLFSNDLGLTEGAIRELFEELALPATDKNRLLRGEGLKIVGVLNDDSSKVGRRHFAFLFQYEVGSDDAWTTPEKGEKSVTQLQWIGDPMSRIPLWNYEYWSQLCLREYFATLIASTPAYRIRRRGPLQPPHVLCVVGTVGSGKSETTKILCKEFGYREVNSGKKVASLIKMPPVPQTPRAMFQKRAQRLVESARGRSRLAKAIAGEVLLIESSKILVDGIRHRATLSALHKYLPKVKIGLIYVHTLPDVAFRLYSRRENRDITFLEFLATRDARVEQDVEKLIGQADGVLYNWIGVEEYRKTIKSMFQILL